MSPVGRRPGHRSCVTGRHLSRSPLTSAHHRSTDGTGRAAFTTVCPGWYSGRAVHIHFKIRTDPDADAGFEATSQLFFDDAFSAEVFATGVYAAKGTPDVLASNDNIYQQSGGTTTLDVTRDGDTLRATFSIAVQIA